MSIDFATLQGLTTPRGVVTQIADASGRVLWMAGSKAILKVTKKTLTTYANETEYANEQFILLDIYPKTNGTVKVTYGGLTKTITDTSGAAEPNAQHVFFGTFNGVSDSVTTPASGELTIEGSFYAFGAGGFKPNSAAKVNTAWCGCITEVIDWGKVTKIPDDGFRDCFKQTDANSLLSINIRVPDGVTTIGGSAFYAKYEATVKDYELIKYPALNEVVLPSSILSIGDDAFEAYAPAQYGGNEYYRSNVRNLIILATTPPALGTTKILFGSNYAHPNSITVPKGCGEAYKAADGWSAYADYIVEAS